MQQLGPAVCLVGAGLCGVDRQSAVCSASGEREQCSLEKVAAERPRSRNAEQRNAGPGRNGALRLLISSVVDASRHSRGLGTGPHTSGMWRVRRSRREACAWTHGSAIAAWDLGVGARACPLGRLFGRVPQQASDAGQLENRGVPVQIEFIRMSSATNTSRSSVHLPSPSTATRARSDARTPSVNLDVFIIAPVAMPSRPAP